MKGKKHIQSKKIIYDGIEFKSNLEKECYAALKAAGFNPKYEFKTYTVTNGFIPHKLFYEPRSRKRGEEKKTHLELIQKTKRVLEITYTPDFEFIHNGHTVIIECKGRPNESFPLRKKLFRALMEKMNDVIYFEPHNKKNIEEIIKILYER